MDKHGRGIKKEKLFGVTCASSNHMESLNPMDICCEGG